MANACLNCVASFKDSTCLIYISTCQNMYVIQGDIMLQKWPGSKFVYAFAHVQSISEMCCKFQIPAFNYCKGSCGDKNSILRCDVVKYVYHSRGHNSATVT